MTTVQIDPGICGLKTKVIAESEDGMEVKITIASGCPSINEITKVLGDTFDSYELCLTKPGENSLYQYVSEHLPGHAACPTIAGIIKAVEVECKLALPKTATISFVQD